MGRRNRGTPKGQRNWFECIRASLRSIGMAFSMAISAFAATVHSNEDWLKGLVSNFPGGKVGLLVGLILGAGLIVQIVEMKREKNTDNTGEAKKPPEANTKDEVK